MSEKTSRPFVVLRDRRIASPNNVFWSSLRDGETAEEARYLADGTLAYDVLLVTLDEAEARSCWAKNSPWGRFASH